MNAQNVLTIRTLPRLSFLLVGQIMAAIILIGLCWVFMFGDEEAWLGVSTKFWSIMTIGATIILVTTIVYAFLGVMFKVNDKISTPRVLLGDSLEGQKLLEATNPIYPDQPIFTEFEQEDRGLYRDRFIKAMSGIRPGWLLCIQYRNPQGFILTEPGKERPFDRSKPEFWPIDWEPIDPQGFDYPTESWEHYLTYREKAMKEYRYWAPQAKMELAPDKAVAWLKSLQCLLPLFFTLLSVTLSAQKSAQVKQYLGEVRYEKDSPKGGVKFHFQKAVLVRNGDGQKPYSYLLTHGDYFTDESNAGSLVAITVKGPADAQAQVIRPEPPTAKPTGSSANADQSLPSSKASREEVQHFMRPNLVQSTVQTASDTESLTLDSMAIAEKLDRSKETITHWKAALWSAIKPIWEFVMWCFTAVLLLIVGVGGYLWYIAKTASGETVQSLYGITFLGDLFRKAHSNAAGGLIVLCWIVALVLLINSFMWIVWLGLNIWLTLLLWAPILWFAAKVTNWIVPNAPSANEVEVAAPVRKYKKISA